MLWHRVIQPYETCALPTEPSSLAICWVSDFGDTVHGEWDGAGLGGVNRQAQSERVRNTRIAAMKHLLCVLDPRHVSWFVETEEVQH